MHKPWRAGHVSTLTAEGDVNRSWKLNLAALGIGVILHSTPLLPLTMWPHWAQWQLHGVNSYRMHVWREEREQDIEVQAGILVKCVGQVRGGCMTIPTLFRLAETCVQHKDDELIENSEAGGMFFGSFGRATCSVGYNEEYGFPQGWRYRFAGISDLELITTVTFEPLP